MVKKLLAAKARNATRDCFGISPAHYAVQGGHRNVVDRLMISAGRMVNSFLIVLSLNY